MKKKTGFHTIDIIFPLVFILFFCFCALLVVLQGAHIYERTAEGLQENYTIRTAASYLKEKVRECPDMSRVEVRVMENKQVLVLREEKKGEIYASYIFLEDGMLRELYTKESSFLGLQGGQALVELDSFSVKLAEDGLLYLEVSAKGQTESLYIRLEG